MAKQKIWYECSNCGYTTTKWLGSCPSCKKWNTLSEKTSQKTNTNDHKARLKGTFEEQSPRKLEDIVFNESNRKSSGIPELNRVLGGGFIEGSYILLGGDPGIGKSTLMLQLAKGNPDLRILYCSGEESAEQIKQRANRLRIHSNKLLVYANTELDKVIQQANDVDPDLLIVDSIQTTYRTELSSMPGSIQQIKECAAMLQKLAKNSGITTLIIGHITKTGDLAGPRVLEHMVDTVLQFEGSDNYTYRILRTLKNRFGPAQEIGLFEMRDRGLIEVTNPSALFVSDFAKPVSGSALVCTMEGTRPLIVEVQALVTPSNYSTPQRTCTGFDHKRLALLIAVLEKRCGINFAQHDVYLNIAGGLKLTEPACDLAIACALVSSMYDKTVKPSSVLMGEIGLGSELRAISNIEQRLKEIRKMGLKYTIAPEMEITNNKLKQDYITVSNLTDALKKCFKEN